MSKGVLGIHHVTAVAGDSQQNVDFYSKVLGLRLVKLTVNFDDPTTYHLYYGDELGHPGTILTFFPWPDAPKGAKGTGQLTVTSFSIPERAMGFWAERLRQNNISFQGPVSRFDEQVLSFTDPDGLSLELVAHHGEKRGGWKEGPVPQDHAIRGFFAVTLLEELHESTAPLLADTLGFRLVRREHGRFRYEAGKGGPGTIVDVLIQPGVPRGFVSVGTVHHVAWRTPDDEQQKALRQEILKTIPSVTPVIDRKYFHSIYFREPGGVLFEVATDPPGFTIDESIAQLGTSLVLPPWLEPSRKEIEQALPRIRLDQLRSSVSATSPTVPSQ